MRDLDLVIAENAMLRGELSRIIIIRRSRQVLRMVPPPFGVAILRVEVLCNLQANDVHVILPVPHFPRPPWILALEIVHAALRIVFGDATAPIAVAVSPELIRARGAVGQLSIGGIVQILSEIVRLALGHEEFEGNLRIPQWLERVLNNLSTMK